MIIIIAGMQRSGSTFSFNVVRGLLESSGRVESLVTDNMSDVRERQNDSENLIVKTHSPCPEMSLAISTGGLKCICTIRRPEDAVMSWSNAFGFSLDDSVKTLRNWLVWHSTISEQTINIPFELIDRWPLFAVSKIARSTLSEVKYRDVFQVYRANRKGQVKSHVKRIERNRKSVTDIGFSFYDSKTLFHRNHISPRGASKASCKLTHDELLALRGRLAPFVNESGVYEWK